MLVEPLAGYPAPSWEAENPEDCTRFGLTPEEPQKTPRRSGVVCPNNSCCTATTGWREHSRMTAHVVLHQRIEAFLALQDGLEALLSSNEFECCTIAELPQEHLRTIVRCSCSTDDCPIAHELSGCVDWIHVCLPVLRAGKHPKRGIHPPGFKEWKPSAAVVKQFYRSSLGFGAERWINAATAIFHGRG